MTFLATCRRPLYAAVAIGLAVSLAACGSKEPPPQAPASAPPTATPEPAAQAPAQPPEATDAPVPTAWTPEALEDLLAPIALYPDPILSQVLIASTNPQEVLDAGNWLLENQSLKGKALDEAAAVVGFTPPIRALIQFPDTVDMMCRELGWTTELGQAFVADQAGVLDAVQRLRRQAKDVGNLQTSPQMTVATQQQNGKEVIVLEPPPSQVVSVPQYDPVAVYAPPPATTTAPATTTTTTEAKTGHSTGTLVTTGLLAFGAGILVNELFDDDDNHKHKNDYWYPNYGYGGMPYYPPYPYRPAYGNGFYPGTGYRPPPGYGGGFYNSGNIIVTNPGGRNDYWDRYDNNRPEYRRATTYQSPISAAKPNRPELNDLNKRQPRPMPADAKRPVKGAEPASWKGKQSYAGADGGYKGTKTAAKDKVAAAPQARPAPKVQGSYKGAPVDKTKRPQGAGDKAAARPAPKPASRDAQNVSRPDTKQAKPRPAGNADRGRPAQPTTRPASFDQPKPAARPAPKPATREAGGGGQKAPRPSGVSGANKSGKADRAASQRGKQSMPQGARSKGGGGGKNKR
jgi:hypothetical protein